LRLLDIARWPSFANRTSLRVNIFSSLELDQKPRCCLDVVDLAVATTLSRSGSHSIKFRTDDSTASYFIDQSCLPVLSVMKWWYTRVFRTHQQGTRIFDSLPRRRRNLYLCWCASCLLNFITCLQAVHVFAGMRAEAKGCPRASNHGLHNSVIIIASPDRCYIATYTTPGRSQGCCVAAPQREAPQPFTRLHLRAAR
jgi:hypothetical protein